MPTNPFRLDGMTALITGCRRGIGLAIAEGLAEAGADIVGVSASLEKSGEDVHTRVNALGGKFSGYRCDLSDRAALYPLIDRVKHDGHRVDILINNAGTTHRAPAAEFPDEQWDKIIELNLTAPFILAREFGKGMLERKKGKIIFIASLMSFQGGLLIPAYVASKGGVSQLVMALANEWASRGVNVNAIAPGYIETDLAGPLKADPVRGPAITTRIPAGKWGKPKDLQGAAVFLASPASDYVHGTTMVVDGGWLGR